MGYKFQAEYLGGFMQDGADIGWSGYSNNSLTAAQLFTSLFERNYSDIKIFQFSDWNHIQSEVIKPESLRFLFPHGFCKEVNTKDEKLIFFQSKKKLEIILVDPNRRNKLRTEENFGYRMSVGPTNNGLYETKNYEVSLEIHDNNVNNGITCTDYNSVGYTYGECLEKTLETQLMKWFGCLPVWFSPAHCKSKQGNATSSLISSFDHNLSCKLPLKPYKSTASMKNVTYQLWHLLINQNLDCMQDCLPPCHTMKIKSKLMLYRDNYKANAQLEIVWHEKVLQTKASLSFDFFNLIVELGSALGLWLGLSAINFLDGLLTLYLKCGNLYRALR
jgi:hypothetical protein